MRSFRPFAVIMAVAVVFTVTACDEQPTEPEQQATFAKKSPVENNGAPSGPHYNLNIIGTSDKNPDMKGNNGHRIFVPLVGNTKIWLTESTDGFYFEVTDANGTDGDGAGFMLPNPDPDCDGTTWYSVYYRLLGTPGGSSTIQTCYKDGADIYCAADLEGGVVAVTKTRQNGKPVFENVSRDLLYVDICTNWDETTGECLQVKQTPLFGLDQYGYLWDYENSGARLAQLRFYEVETITDFTSEDLVCD